MPSIEWNKRHWTASMNLHLDETVQEFSYGDQWGTFESHPPLIAVRDAWLRPFVGPDKTVLEVGTGGGRWTEHLLNAAMLYSVDVNPVMLEYSARRFGDVDNLSLILTDGESLPGVPAGEIDFVFSFGTFVHIDPPLIRKYLRAFRPLLRPGAELVIQYADKTKPTAARNIHFAHTDALLMEALVCAEGYRVVRHDTGLIHHSNLIHFRAAPPAQAPWPLATDAPVRLLAWPDYRSAADVLYLFQTYGAALAAQPGACLCLRRDPRADLPAADVERILTEALSLAVPGADLDVLLIDEDIAVADWPRLGGAVAASIDLPSAASGRRAAMLSAVGVPRVRSAAQLHRVLPS